MKKMEKYDAYKHGIIEPNKHGQYYHVDDVDSLVGELESKIEELKKELEDLRVDDD